MEPPKREAIDVNAGDEKKLFAPKVVDCQSCGDAASYHAEAYDGMVEDRDDEALRAEASLIACKYHGNRSRKILSAIQFIGFTQYFLTLANGESFLSDSPKKLVNAKPYKPG